MIDYFAMIIAEPKFVAGEREVLPLVLSLDLNATGLLPDGHVADW